MNILACIWSLTTILAIVAKLIFWPVNGHKSPVLAIVAKMNILVCMLR
jgi:hypothetical protein